MNQMTKYNPMTKYIVAMIAAAALTTDLAGIASAQTQSAYTNGPVTVQSFTSYPALPPLQLSTFGALNFTPTSSDVTISFVNTGSVPAKSVEFAVTTGNRTETIVDNGTFAPGTSIVHTFKKGARFVNASAVRVQAVTFADGTTWND
jgi:hypothetical protein